MLSMLQSPSNQSLQMLQSAPQLAKVNAPQTRTQVLSPQQLKKIDASAQDFESVYMTEMLKPMFETVKTDKMFGGGQAEDTFKSLLLQQYGKKIAETGGMGLAKYVKADMIRMQETQK